MEEREIHYNDPEDRRGAQLKFRFRTRSAGLRAEVGGWKNRDESRQCVMCSVCEDKDVEHVLMRCEAYKSEIVQLWEGVRSECWEKLDQEEKVKVLLGKDMQEEEATDKSVKRSIRKVKRRWMDLGNGQ